MIFSLWIGYKYFIQNEYYIPKPEALIKINSPSEELALFKNDICVFYYSLSSVVKENTNNSLSIIYPEYYSRIDFFIKDLEDLSLEIYNFQNSITVHENQGAIINANIIENKDSDIYGILCYLEGNNIATSAQFFLTDSINYFINGGISFKSAINPDIIPQNNIMKSELINFISSFRWSENDKLDRL